LFHRKYRRIYRGIRSEIEGQLNGQKREVVQLACELVYLYLLFPSSITFRRKKELLKTIASFADLILDDQNDALTALEHGIGGPGIAYNTRRYYEIRYIAMFADTVLLMSKEERIELVADHLKVRSLLDKLKEDTNPLTRHILLHLLYPDLYGRMASASHKQQIVEAFLDMLDEDSIPVDIDDRILAIRTQLNSILGDTDLDFYRSPLKECWDYSDHESDVLPIQGLQIKKKIVLYGPPGTGKTHEAKGLAERFIRQEALRQWGAGKFFKNQDEINELIQHRVRRVQFHPGYGYEDFIRGMQLEQNRMVYKNGVFLQVLEAMKAAENGKGNGLPFVFILDEMNRADLSKVLGECFSLLEDRESEVLLSGQDGNSFSLAVPDNLYIIGTMNLIDQSLEQVDFALRRRFLWFFRGFERDDLISLVKTKWERWPQKYGKPRQWSRVEEDFEILADRCVSLNTLIANREFMGSLYVIGHTYFSDVVSFAQKYIYSQPGVQQVLWNRKGQGRGPITALWNYSLAPLLEQYLSGADAYERKLFMQQAKDIFLWGQG
jgi:5-methylcytosine-specific restriction protein B